MITSASVAITTARLLCRYCTEYAMWQDHISNNEVRRQVQRERTVLDTMRQRKLQLFSLQNVGRPNAEVIAVSAGKFGWVT